MITHGRDVVAELINTPPRRAVIAYGYLAVVGGFVVLLDFATRNESVRHPDNIGEVIFVVAIVMILSRVSVQLDRGRLTLTGLVIGAAAIVFNPLDATVAGLAVSIAIVHRGRWPILANSVLAAAYASFGSVVAIQLQSQGELGLAQRVITLILLNLFSWLIVAIALSVRGGEPVASIARHNFTPSFYLAFGYFALGSLLISYVLDGSVRGYVLATIVCVLALALTDTIAGRRVRRVLESELSDADRHLFHSRAVEGVVHNLRNHVATAVGYLKEIDLHRLDPVDREAVETATAAANDAVTVLRSLSQGATPRVSYATEPVDLNELVNRAIGMARPRARSKEIQLAVRESAEEVKVKADPLLLREVITNLVNNAVDAAPPNGRVELSTGRRNNGWPFFTVADNGPGVSDDHRHHLFEPHFTTKEGGTGLGLFMSYGVVREHQGDIVYSGSNRGAVFTVVLPPFRG